MKSTSMNPSKIFREICYSASLKLKCIADSLPLQGKKNTLYVSSTAIRLRRNLKYLEWTKSTLTNNEDPSVKLYTLYSNALKALQVTTLGKDWRVQNILVWKRRLIGTACVLKTAFIWFLILTSRSQHNV